MELSPRQNRNTYKGSCSLNFDWKNFKKRKKKKPKQTLQTLLNLDTDKLKFTCQTSFVNCVSLSKIIFLIPTNFLKPKKMIGVVTN